MQIYPTHCLQLPRRLHAPKLNSMPAPAPAPLLVSFRSVRCGSSGFPRHVNIIKLCTNKSNHGAARCEEQTARMQPPSTGNTHVSICFKLVCSLPLSPLAAVRPSGAGCGPPLLLLLLLLSGSRQSSINKSRKNNTARNQIKYCACCKGTKRYGELAEGEGEGDAGG